MQEYLTTKERMTTVVDMSGKTFGQRLREKRKERKLTQEVVANLVGVKRAAISQWENDDSLPKGAHMFSLSRALNWDLKEMSNSNRVNKDDFFNGMSSDAIMLVKRIKELDGENSDIIKSVLTLIGNTAEF